MKNQLLVHNKDRQHFVYKKKKKIEQSGNNTRMQEAEVCVRAYVCSFRFRQPCDVKTVLQLAKAYIKVKIMHLFFFIYHSRDRHTYTYISQKRTRNCNPKLQNIRILSL